MALSEVTDNEHNGSGNLTDGHATDNPQQLEVVTSLILQIYFSNHKFDAIETLQNCFSDKFLALSILLNFLHLTFNHMKNPNTMVSSSSKSSNSSSSRGGKSDKNKKFSVGEDEPNKVSRLRYCHSYNMASHPRLLLALESQHTEKPTIVKESIKQTLTAENDGSAGGYPPYWVIDSFIEVCVQPAVKSQDQNRVLENQKLIFKDIGGSFEDILDPVLTVSAVSALIKRFHHLLSLNTA
jgi:hypothetical protein